MKKMKTNICLALIFTMALFLTQCSNVEMLDYHHVSPSKEQSAHQEFYNFSSNHIDINKINKVLFIGDSHIANDAMSDLFRKRLHANSKFNNFITPKYQQNSALRMTWEGFDKTLLKDKEIGINLVTYKSNSNANVKFNGDIKNPNIFVNFTNDNSKFIIKQNEEIVSIIQAKYTNKWQKININISGDFEILADADIYFAGIENDSDKYVDNLGVNGASLVWWYYTNKELFEMQIQGFNYDVAFISFGTNEAINPHTNIKDYKQNLIKLIHILKKSNTQIVLLSPHYSVYYDGENYVKAPLFDEIKTTLMEVAKSENIMLYDMNAFMENMGGKDNMIENGYSQKDTHLSLNGYYKVADKIYKSFEGL